MCAVVIKLNKKYVGTAMGWFYGVGDGGKKGVADGNTVLFFVFT